MEFLKVFEDMRQLFEPYTDDERGRLFTAMMDYCFDGVEPQFGGNERFIWPVLRRHINQCAEKAETLRENARKGGRPKNQAKANETKQNQSETKRNQTKPEQEQEQEHEQEQEQEQEDARVIAIDGNDIREDIARNQVADALIMSYRLGRDDRTREALLHDLAEHGEARMREVLDKAADGNTREKISVNYWRAILADKSRATPKGYQQRAHDQSYWDSIEVKFDANGDPIA